jgi:GDP-4-dehydro-6-deoxy-D-mannose reductase
MRALVTGGSGFVGRHLIAHLHSFGDTVEVVDHSGPAPVDVTDAEALRARFAAVVPDVVYHLAAHTHVGDSWDAEREVFRVNVDGTACVLAACESARVGRVIVVGSAEEYGTVDDLGVPLLETAPLRPLSPYARSKVAAEELAVAAFRDRGLGVICVRAFNHTGPGQSPRFLVPGLAARIVAAEREGHETITVGNLDPVRDYSDVRDVVRAYRLLAERGEPGTVYNVCSGRGIAVGEIARALLALAERPLRLEIDPALVRATDVPVLVGDATRLEHATAWRPEIPLDRTLADVLSAARAAA